ncbi:nucleotide exchange factor GrpE [Methanosarcina sp. KYL-1]|uniref:nucleotide exchange factor GrpE n=1 Tax=Methanosarcina sp. KYL-1 TaxID=2602068 RepID=UPI002101AA69|nr:nucleotide exchange factor GrpE [Methanosarcina sp. KYL-1]MCQ1537283.1 nucleotide exchange factor GrpE [Methanosarcina sp. KYL-1]
MKRFGKKENKDSNEDESRMEAESSGAENSPSAEGAGEAKRRPETEPADVGAGKSAEAACREENEILKDQLFRLAADFDNYRKRTARQMEESRKVVLENVLLDFVEVTDNFERALKSARSAEDMNSVISGIEQLSRQFFSILEKHGLKKIECEKASEFDPHRHEAVQHVETSQLPDNTVLEVYKPGYTLNSKVIRPAMVAVARNPDETGTNQEGPGNE